MEGWIWGVYEAEVQALMNTLNKNLDAEYNCTKTGADLLNEVKFYRRLDLWGEGQNWFDYTGLQSAGSQLNLLAYKGSDH